MALEHFLPPIVTRGDIFAFLCGPRAFIFIKIWPAYTFEFETPDLDEDCHLPFAFDVVVCGRV